MGVCLGFVRFPARSLRLALLSPRLSPVPPLGSSWSPSAHPACSGSSRSPSPGSLFRQSVPRLPPSEYVLSRVGVGHPPSQGSCPTLIGPRIRSHAGGCGTLWRNISLPPACSSRSPPFSALFPVSPLRSPALFPVSLPVLLSGSCFFPRSLFSPKCPTFTPVRIHSLAGWCGTFPFPSPVSHAHRPENTLSRGWLWDTLAKLTDVPLICPKVPKPHRYGNIGEPTTDCKKKVLQKLGKTAATPHLCK